MSIFLLKSKEEKPKETDEEKKQRIGIPDQDIEELLKQFKCEESIPKIKEHAIDKNQFWNLEIGQLEELLEVKIFGRRKKLFKRMTEIKKKNEEDAEEVRKLEDEVDKTGVIGLMRANTLPLKSGK